MPAQPASMPGAVVTALKAVHLAALILWCAGLLALPLLLARHDPQQSQSAYARLRLLTDASFRLLMTPAAVVAIVAGAALVFAREVYAPWMLAKLAAVGLLVALHAWLGVAVTRMGESAGQHPAPGAAWPVGMAMALISVVLLLVLGKPALTADRLPGWLNEPRYRALPVGDVPAAATPT